MKFDKETAIVLIAATVILILWFAFYPQQQPAPRGARKAAPAAAKSVSTQPASQPVPAPAAVSAPKAPESVPEKEVPAQLLVLANKLVEFTIDARTGRIEKAILLSDKYRVADKSGPIEIGNVSSIKTFSTNFLPAGVVVSDVKVTEDKPSNTIHLVRTCSNGLVVTQTLSLPDGNYLLSNSYTISNPTNATVTLPAWSVSLGGIPPMNALSGDKVYSDRHNIEFASAFDHSVSSLDPSVKDAKFNSFGSNHTSVEWIGVTNKYFAVLLFADSKTPFIGFTPARQYFLSTRSGNKGKSDILPSGAGHYASSVIPAGGSQSWQFRYYCGPKEISLFEQLPENAMQVLHFSYFSWFDVLAKPLVRFLIYLHSLVGSYGLAIIILTLIVRLIFWPITQKANNSMRRMQKVQPLLKEIREKYKDNPQEMNMRMMELYRKEKINPVGGCLPILLQIPVFFALYSALDAAVELRQSSFLWAADLAKPDLIGPQINLPILGPTGLHPFVILMTILMLVQQKMTPGMGDPTQKKMMMFMPVIMLFMLYNLPSGLTLYWTVSNVFSILQLKYGQIAAKREEEREKASPAKQ